MKRSGKFYYKNEKEVMEKLGLSQVPGSGNGWIHKEDGANDHVLCQLKSTDKQSIKINKLDLEKLEYNAGVSKKIPVFAIEFLSDRSLYLAIKPEDLTEIVKYLNLSNKEYSKEKRLGIDLVDIEDVKVKPKSKKVKSNANAREEFRNELNNKYKKEKSAK